MSKKKKTKRVKETASSSLHTDCALLDCPCGGSPVLQISKNRVTAKDEAIDLLVRAEAARDSGAVVSQQALLKAIDDSQSDNEDVAAEAAEVIERAREAQLGTRKSLETIQHKIQCLENNVVEVRCPDCNSFIWHGDPEGGDIADEEAQKRAIHYAVGCWNRAVEKLETLEDCCKECASDPKCRKVDHDGMVVVKCHHCGIRHHPLGNYVIH